MVVFVSLNALFGILSVDLIIRIHFLNDALVNWDWIKTNLYSFKIEFRRYEVIPWMQSNLSNSKSFFRICVQYFTKQIFRLI
jgi:hypothetical protein